MRKTILTFNFLLFFAAITTAQKSAGTIQKLLFDKVVVYHLDPSPEEPDFRTYDTAELLQKGIVFQELNGPDFKKLKAYLIAASSFDRGASICWQPHLGMTFFYRGKPVNYISVCLECNKLKSAVLIPAAEKIPMEGGINFEKGLSVRFRQYLIRLVKKYKVG